MKRYGICFFLSAAAAVLGFALGLGIGRNYTRYEEAVPDGVYETETVPESLPENRVVINQEHIEPATEAVRTERFFLVSETGYLLVFTEDEPEECVQTHIPITDFPEEEQNKLREGMWFESMMDVFFYLESYTS